MTNTINRDMTRMVGKTVKVEVYQQSSAEELTEVVIGRLNYFAHNIQDGTIVFLFQGTSEPIRYPGTMNISIYVSKIGD